MLDVERFRKDSFATTTTDGNKFIFFYNSRNAKRKNTGSIVWWFNDFLNEVGKDKSTLILHTDPTDPNGCDLEQIIEYLGLTNGEVLFSRQKIPPEALAMIYNMADCTISASSAEGWGIFLMESMSCETPVIATWTGGMKDQLTDGENWFGIPVYPAAQTLVGSSGRDQFGYMVPYIYDDAISGKDFVEAMKKMYYMSKEERDEWGKKGREHILKNMNYERFQTRWVELMLELYEKYGSWNVLGRRKGYQGWKLMEIK